MDLESEERSNVKTATVVAPGIAVVDEPIQDAMVRRGKYWLRESTTPLEKGILERFNNYYIQGRWNRIIRGKWGIPKEPSLEKTMKFKEYVEELLDELGKVPAGQVLLEAIEKLSPVPGGFDPTNPSEFPVKDFIQKSGKMGYPYFEEDLVPGSRQHFSKAETTSFNNKKWQVRAEGIRILIFNSGEDIRNMAVMPYDKDFDSDGHGTPVIVGLPFPGLLQVGDNIWAPQLMLASLLCRAVHALCGASDNTLVEVPASVTPTNFSTYQTTVSAALALGNKHAIRSIYLGNGFSALVRTVLREVPQFTASAKMAEDFAALIKSNQGDAGTWETVAKERKIGWIVQENMIAEQLKYPLRKTTEQAARKSFGVRQLRVSPKTLAADKDRMKYPSQGFSQGYWGSLQSLGDLTGTYYKIWSYLFYIDKVLKYVSLPVAGLVTFGVLPDVLPKGWTAPVKHLYRLQSVAKWGAFWLVESVSPTAKRADEVLQSGDIWQRKATAWLESEMPKTMDVAAREEEEILPNVADAAREYGELGQAGATGESRPYWVWDEKERNWLEVIGWVAKKPITAATLDFVKVPYLQALITGSGLIATAQEQRGKDPDPWNPSKRIPKVITWLTKDNVARDKWKPAKSN
ncbi:hypothetical protein [Streptomyces sp. NPDC001635]